MLTIDWVSDRLIAASGTITVRVTAADGADVSFKLRDAADNYSATKTVTDGGPEDLADLKGVIETSLDLDQLFDERPDSGNVKIFAGTGDDFTISEQTFDAKGQVNVDADAPSATITNGASGPPNSEVEIGYTAEDVRDNVRTIAMQVLGQDGTVHRTVSALDQGSGNAAQFPVPAGLDPGPYDVRLVMVDEVGNVSTDVREDGLVLEEGPGGSTEVERTNVVGALDVLDDQPVSATGSIAVRVVAGKTVSFKVQDSAGTTSATKTVTDGGSEDRASTSGLVETTLDLDQLFEQSPETGVGRIYAGDGEDLSIAHERFGSKEQVAIDAEAPTVALPSEVTGQPGERARVTYTVTDDREKVRTITLQATDPDGNSHHTISGLQVGRDATTEVQIPSSMDPGEYDLTLVAIDQAGHRASETLEGGLVVRKSSETATPVSGLQILTDQPVAGSGAVTVRANVADSSTAAFKLEDAAGTISATGTVTEGGTNDRSATAGMVETTLDLGQLFEQSPESGTAILYAGSGEGFDVDQEGFDTKRELDIDADPPTVSITSGASGAPGEQVKIGYEVTDVPQKLRSITLTLVGPNGTTTQPDADLQEGTGRTAQFEIPMNLRPGRYDVRLVAVDEVGHDVADTLGEGLVVTPRRQR